LESGGGVVVACNDVENGPDIAIPIDIPVAVGGYIIDGPPIDDIIDGFDGVDDVDDVDDVADDEDEDDDEEETIEGGIPFGGTDDDDGARFGG